jgi:hypothetical protein
MNAATARITGRLELPVAGTVGDVTDVVVWSAAPVLVLVAIGTRAFSGVDIAVTLLTS